MRILIATHSYSPNADGVSEAVSSMVNGFENLGWKVDVATAPVTTGSNNSQVRGESIYEFRVKGTRHPRHPYSGEAKEYQNFLINGNWDIIIIHAYLWPLYLALEVIDRITSKKVLVSHGFAALRWVRSSKFPWGLATLIRGVASAFRMARWITKFDRVVYLSEKRDYAWFLDQRIARLSRYTGGRVIPNGVDLTENFNPTGTFRHLHGIPDNAFMFLCVANYTKGKDQGCGARSFRKANLPQAHLVFIGSEFNEHSKKFQAEDASLPIDQRSGTIHWLENISKKEINQAFASCDTFILPSIFEAQPIVLLEAMRESKAWIARDVGCISEIPGGTIVKSEEQMADAIRRLVNDRELRERLGKEGYSAVATRYNREAYVESYCKLVEELLASKV